MALPTLQDLSKFGRVPNIALLMGLSLFVIGSTQGEVSVSNTKLMLGAALICLGFVWSYGSRMVDSDFYDGEKTRRFVSWPSVFGFVIFALAEAILLYGFLKGRFPFRLPG